MKTNPALLLIALAALLCAGCSHRLPNIKAEEVHSRTSVAGVFVATADATGINVTDTMIRAADAKWTISLLGFDQTTAAKGYQQKRDKEETK